MSDFSNIIVQFEDSKYNYLSKVDAGSTTEQANEHFKGLKINRGEHFEDIQISTGCLFVDENTTSGLKEIYTRLEDANKILVDLRKSIALHYHGLEFGASKARNFRLQNLLQEKKDNVAEIELEILIVFKLLEIGFSGLALSKQHYSENENAFKSYQEYSISGHKVIARQFSDFFGFRVKE